MNILVVHNRYQIPGGEDTVFEAETAMLRKHGHHVAVYERSNSELNGMGKLQKLTVPFSMIYSFRTAREIRDLIQREQIQLVHVHNTLLLISPSVYYAALKQQIPVVQTIHNFRMICVNGICYRDGRICEDCITKNLFCAIKHRCYRSSLFQSTACVVSTLVHRAAGIYRKLNYICLTEFNRDQLLKQGQISESQIFIKPNCMEAPASIVPHEKRKNQIIFAGRLDESKGILFLLEVWKRMEVHPFELRIYGSGPLEEECREYIKCHELRDIQLCGRKDHEELLNIISESNALILPTRWYEGFPMSMLEAMSRGTPVIVPDLGNAGSLTVNSVTGYTYQPDHAEDCIRALNENLNINETVFQYFKDHYTEEKNYRILMEIYQKVTGDKHE